ncbi:unnamed protein product, partial [Soboliphyme baturini]|uniref:cDNA n=1 Tax=Soboliphyme baturini TaxID=241478 RepID=A0A183IAE7_9BILA
MWPKGCMQLSPALPVQLLSKGMVSTWYQGQSRAVKLRVPPSGEFGKQASEAGSLSTQAGLRGRGMSDLATQAWPHPRPEVRAGLRPPRPRPASGPGFGACRGEESGNSLKGAR